MNSDLFSLLDEDQKLKLEALTGLSEEAPAVEKDPEALAKQEAGKAIDKLANYKIGPSNFDGNIKPPKISQENLPGLSDLFSSAKEAAPFIAAAAASDKYGKKDIKKAGKSSISDFLRGK